MKWFYLASLLLLGALCCNASEDDLQDITKDSDDEIDFDELVELIQKKCKEVGGDGAFANLTRSLEGLKDCLDDHLPDTADELKELKDSSEESSPDICTEKRPKIRECFNTVVEALEDCSEAEEKYIPHFILDALKGVLDYVCADEDAFILKVIGSLECLETLSKQKEELKGTCSSKLQSLKGDSPSDITVTKEELCEDLEIARTCAAKLIEEKCPGSDFKDVVVGILSGVSSACEERHKRSLPLSFKLF